MIRLIRPQVLHGQAGKYCPLVLVVIFKLVFNLVIKVIVALIPILCDCQCCLVLCTPPSLKYKHPPWITKVNNHPVTPGGKEHRYKANSRAGSPSRNCSRNYNSSLLHPEPAIACAAQSAWAPASTLGLVSQKMRVAITSKINQKQKTKMHRRQIQCLRFAQI